MRELTSIERQLVNQKKQTVRPILTVNGEPSQITEETETYLILLPNEVKQLLLWQIDQTLANSGEESGIQLRLLTELADTSSLAYRQRYNVYAEQLKTHNSLLQYLQGGVTSDGSPLITAQPNSIKMLMALLRYPSKELLSLQAQCDYDQRVNAYVIDQIKHSRLIDSDLKLLESWRSVIAVYTENATALDFSFNFQHGNTSYISGTAGRKGLKLSDEKKRVRQIICEVAEATKYPTNRLLAQLYQESKYDPRALGPALKSAPKGAAGLGQFVIATGTQFGLRNYTEGYFIARDSAIATVGYMRWINQQLSRCQAGEEDRWRLCLAAYNWGIGNVVEFLAKHGYVQGSKGKVISSKRPIQWAAISGLGWPNQTSDYVSKIEQYAKNPP